MLLTSFIAGFFGSLSPCVYPLIPITLSVMGVRRYDTHWHGFRIALSYVAGMILLHTGLGVLFAYVGILAGSSLQSPWSNLLIASLLFAMALNLLGFYTWALPPKANQWLTHLGAKQGHKSAFLMGLAAGIIAVPCTGPLLAGILTMIAEKRDLTEGIFLMLAYAIGMGLPFLILGTFSSSVSKLPKSGPWMNRIKVLLGIVMLWLCSHYINQAYHGFTHDFASVQMIEHQIEQAHGQNKRVILDFWADWCTLCHEIDEKTFRDPRVQKALENYTVIRIDVTLDSPENQKLLGTYGVVGLPSLVFLETGEKINGFVSPEQFLKILTKQLKGRE